MASEKQVGRIDVSAATCRSDMVVARCWQQWITERWPVAEGQDVPGTQMITRIVQSEEWPLRHQQRR
ncbi:hypothetical protein TNCV_1887631 [Trichonephila clavipes]|nr:hypothetical protein TNCV_1887631 [Trichonephila clavipes]